MKKLIVTLITAIMIMTFSIPAAVSADGGEGSITINGASSENIYSIYKLLNLESYDADAGTYSYKISSEWEEFFVTGAGKDYVKISDDMHKYVTWNSGDDADTVAGFAKKALAFAKAKGILPVKSSANSGEFSLSGDVGIFTGLELGYYLVDSTMGSLCGLTTTNPNAYIMAKNAAPTIDKQVKEDSTSQWGGTNTADIGQTVEFRVTINVHSGAENYIFHDKMSTGLTFKDVTLIQHVIPGNETHSVPTDKYEVVTTGLGDGCTFEVVFDQELCDELETNDKVVIFYEAMLNRNAVVAGEGNSNEAWLEFGEEHFSNHDSTQTYTYAFDLVKTNSQNTLIDGAEFKIYDALTGGNEVSVVLMEDGVTYRRARADETGVTIVVTDGQVRIKGFDNGTYYLEETKAPDGYQKLAARSKFIISDSNLDAVYNDGAYSTGSGVHVVNNSGNILPQTGGMGTTIFIIVGGLAVLLAGILLFVRRRVSQYE